MSPYQKYKPFLRREFEKKCIFCRMPDTMKDYELYGVEHYKPKSAFPHLTTRYSNLFYSCNPCNRRKGEYWPPRGKGKTHFIPNPCDHEMFKHLRFVGGIVEARTSAGEVARDLLDLNDPEAIRYRKFIVDAIVTYTKKKQQLEDARAQLQVLQDDGTYSSDEVSEALALIEGDLNSVDEYLERLAGN